MHTSHPPRGSGETANLRDALATERTRLANERTLLAYVRTALALLGAGAALLRFFPSVADQWGGCALVAAGAVVLPFGVYRFTRVNLRLSRAHPQEWRYRGNAQ